MLFGLILNFNYLFLNLKKTLINKKLEIKNKTKPQCSSTEGREGDDNQDGIRRREDNCETTLHTFSHTFSSTSISKNYK